MKINLQVGKSSDFELDIFESFCTVPIILEDKMIIGNFIVCLDLVDETFELLPKELKKILEKKGCKSFYLEKSIFTVTKLTAYNISIGAEKNEINTERIFDNFSEKRTVYELSTTCNFPNESMVIHFQTIGQMFIEFELEDVFFINEPTMWYDIWKKEREKINNFNKENYSNFLKKIHRNQIVNGIE